MYLSRYVGDLKCGFLVLATKEKSKCVSLDNVLKHSHLRNIVSVHMIVMMMWNCWFQECDTCQTRSDDDGDGDGDDDDAKLLVSKMRHLLKREWINGSPTPPQ